MFPRGVDGLVKRMAVGFRVRDYNLKSVGDCGKLSFGFQILTILLDAYFF